MFGTLGTDNPYFWDVVYDNATESATKKNGTADALGRSAVARIETGSQVTGCVKMHVYLYVSYKGRPSSYDRDNDMRFRECPRAAPPRKPSGKSPVNCRQSPEPVAHCLFAHASCSAPFVRHLGLLLLGVLHHPPPALATE